MKSIFTDNFPFVSNDQELQLLKDKYPDYDSYYIASGSIEERKDKFDKLFKQYQPYSDSNFLIEIKKKFHQRTWEMYLGCALMDRGIILSPKKEEGPDLLIVHAGKKIWIECVACEKGDGADRVPDLEYGTVQNVPSDEMLIRIAGALKEKHEKYKKYISKGIIEKTDQFIIAINRGELSHVDTGLPLILRAVLAIGHPTLSWPTGEGGNGPGKTGWGREASIKKRNGSEVPMTFFLEKDHDGISAVIYCKDTVLNHPENLGENIILVHNELSINPLQDGVFDSFRQYKCDENGNMEL